MPGFRVAIYCSGIQPFDLLHSAEAPRPIHKISQAMDFASCSEIVFHMRVLHGQAVGIVPDSRQMVEFYSQPQVAFTILPYKCHLTAVAETAFLGCPQPMPTKVVLAKQAAKNPNPNVHKASPEQIAWAQALKAKALGTSPPACGGQATITISAPAPLTPPQPLPMKPLASGDKLAWWQRLLLWWFSLWLRAAGRSREEDCCGK